MIDVIFNDISGKSIGIYATDRPSVPAAVEKIEEIDIPGRDTVLHVPTGTFENQEFAISFNYKGSFYDKWRKAKKWLLSGKGKLRFSDDPDMFLRISKVTLSNNERRSDSIGSFTGTFSTDALNYYCAGATFMELKMAVNNPGITCKPVYKLTGEGLCRITTETTVIEVDVSDNVIIDTERMLTYRENGQLINKALKGSYEDLYLLNGINNLQITDGFGCMIQPNWRCL